MMDERAFIRRVEDSDTDEFAQILARPNLEEERALRAHFGEERYKRLHARALRRSVRGAARASRGNVVVIHGIMGGELTAYRGGDSDQIWARVFALIRGHVRRLRLADDGRADFEQGTQVQATGIMKTAYGEMLLALAERWNVRGFWYDWRKDLTLAAAELDTKINAWFGPNAPVHIVAHSMGGLVARTMIKDRAARWHKMLDKSAPAAGGRLIMLGTPNHGSFAIPQVITGLEGMVRKLALADMHHSLEELLPIFNSFVGSYQMLPSPFAMGDVEWLYDAKSYGKFNIPQAHLDTARAHHDALRNIIDTHRMVYIAGYNQPTFNGIPSRRPAERQAYTVTRKGDGRVPHELGLLKGVAKYFVEEGHGDLPGNEAVLATVEELLATGKSSVLPGDMPAIRTGGERADRAQVWKEEDEDVARFGVLVQRAQTRSDDRTLQHQVSSTERELRDSVTRGFLPSGSLTRRVTTESESERPAATVQVALIHGDIAATDEFDFAELPIDAIAVGHYVGVLPQNAERALDRAISTALRNATRHNDRGVIAARSDVLAQYAERGILRGELGQPFFLNDPRAKRSSRVIAITGMGLPGRFGEPELTVAARELCWSLGRIGKRHLATVLIGGGIGNLPAEVAVRAWLRGIRLALTGSTEGEAQHLTRVTFVERDPRRIPEFHKALLQETKAIAKTLDVRYRMPTTQVLRRLQRAGSELARREWLAKNGNEVEAPADSLRPLTRLTVDLNQGTYRFGAVTDSASIPERDIALDPALVMKANDELIGEGDARMQRKRGEFLGKLLVPTELRGQLISSAPVVMMMDSTTARIHWEMVAHSEAAPGMSKSALQLEDFLGTGRGFTRQLRTTFAPPPEPPPPPRRVLRVLVVADPAADAHLPGAEAEGAEVANLCRSFNTVHAARTSSRVEVTTLFGPTEATRTNVLSELMTAPYDVLHFAGHCTFKPDPNRSGWVFSDGELLTANELNRVDRIPKFVFSNACESGVMRDRPSDRSVELAPGFAEAFFARGVANFVCTAWPVDDTAAREFALTLYGGLLGLSRGSDGSGRYIAAAPLMMYEAMREARRAIATRDYGARTWGAYQHYGNPYLQLFAAALRGAAGETAASPRTKRSSKSRPQGRVATKKVRIARGKSVPAANKKRIAARSRA
jgi:pimeloyl-ACP methyl ester carboxylesterase